MMAVNSAQALMSMEPATPTEPLRVPVHFLCLDSMIWDELRGDPELPLPKEGMRRHSGGDMGSWILLVYHWIRTYGNDFTIDPKISDDAVNIVGSRGFRCSYRTKPTFFLGCRADAHVQIMAKFVVYQNAQYRPNRFAANVNHWPQAGMIPRDPARGTDVKVLSYMGTQQNLDSKFQSDTFRAALKKIGVALGLRFKNKATGAHSWQDYSNTDAVLAVRGQSTYMSGIKPSTKLANAWFAGAPAFVGPEPAYLEIRESELDFIQAVSPEQVIAGLKMLEGKPELYKAMVEHGVGRTGPYTRAAITQSWATIINEAVFPEFKKWHARPFITKLPFMWASIALNPAMKALHEFRVKYGQRLLA